jgi:hypothetical protein
MDSLAMLHGCVSVRNSYRLRLNIHLHARYEGAKRSERGTLQSLRWSSGRPKQSHVEPELPATIPQLADGASF